MSNYIALKSVGCLYFFESKTSYPLDNRNRVCFTEGVHLEDMDSEWVQRLSKTDKKLIQKDLKKIKKI